MVSITSVAMVVLSVMGCRPDQSIDAIKLADAQASYDSAIEAIEAGNAEAALELLDRALQPGAGLPPDISVGARIQRAICLARVDRTPDAHADLDNASQGAGDLSAVHVVRAFVYSKEGKAEESKNEMRIARSLNRTVKRISD